MKIAVVGAGWYGCHVACQLLDLGIEVDVFEKGADVFTGASGFNQNRLHLGFHYPRSAATRREAMSGYARFKAVYPELSERVPRNMYAIVERESLVDADTYRQVMGASGLRWSEVDPAQLPLKHVTAALEVEEELIRTNAARSAFRTKLKPHLRLGVAVRIVEHRGKGVLVDGEAYEFAVDCTGGSLAQNVWSEVYFEPFLTLLYEAKHRAVSALTLMDGPFFSIYPFEGGLYTLTSVARSPLGRMSSSEEALVKLRSLAAGDVAQIRHAVECETQCYYPSFLDDFGFSGFFTTMKTKRPSGSDDRCTTLQRRGQVIHILPGKIDTVFAAGDMVTKAVCGS